MGRRRPMASRPLQCESYCLEVLICSQMAVTATFGLWFSSRYNSSMAFLTCLFLQQIAWNSAHAAHSALLSDPRRFCLWDLVHSGFDPPSMHRACFLNPDHQRACRWHAWDAVLSRPGAERPGCEQRLVLSGREGLNNNYIYAAQAVATYLLLPVTQIAAQEAGSFPCHRAKSPWLM